MGPDEFDFDDLCIGESYEFVHARHGTFVATVTGTRWDDDADEGIINAELVAGVIKRASGDIAPPCKLMMRWSKIESVATL